MKVGTWNSHVNIDSRWWYLVCPLVSTKGPSINNVSFDREGGGIKNEVLRQFLGLKLGRQGEGGRCKNSKRGDIVYGCSLTLKVFGFSKCSFSQKVTIVISTSKFLKKPDKRNRQEQCEIVPT